MSKKIQLLIIILMIFFMILSVVLVVVYLVGGAYRSRITDVTSSDTPKEIARVTTGRITKLTIHRNSTDGCVEITPDGIVVIYDVCGEDPVETYRSQDVLGVGKLFKMISSGNYSRTKIPRAYRVIVHTTLGDIVVYIPSGPVGGGGLSGGAGGTGSQPDISDIIDSIIDQKPTPTFLPTQPAPYTPTPIITYTLTPTPVPTQTYFLSPTPTPLSYQQGGLFSCDFYTDPLVGKKPYRVSNVVCSTDPLPL